MEGAIQRANEETIEELKSILGRVGAEYAKPALKLLAPAAGVPEPLADIFISAIKNCTDAYRRHDSEEAEFRAQTAIGMAGHLDLHPNLYKQVTPAKLRSLYQRLTRHAVEVRVEDVVRVVVAAALGGSDGDVATPVDLLAAEWLERLEDSKLMHLRNVCDALFPEDVLCPFLQVPELNKVSFAKFKTPPIRTTVSEWQRDAPDWPTFKKELFISAGQVAYCEDKAKIWGHHVATEGEFWSGTDRWVRIDFFPSLLLQRAHNAFSRAKHAMQYELKLHTSTQGA